ncbi:hypothetical protein Purlil1_13811 [Purpureocillium lilacinum]|uniref:Uncharacterized protein n=1 Tax=Purpureocillium lilacinum TaxID=33203 RepID=A0ABR0BD34_PURLI|nr:hypothetical protein Purlil1_13811 [Purpureocillium lilacinum]
MPLSTSFAVPSSDLYLHAFGGLSELDSAHTNQLTWAVRQWASAKCVSDHAQPYTSDLRTRKSTRAPSLTTRNWTDAPTTEIGRLQPDDAAGDRATTSRT